MEVITKRILWIRDEKVMLDRDLADLYGVGTKVLNQAVHRNLERFPEDFMFRLTKEEMSELVTNCDRFHSLKHSAVASRAFTEHGVAMLATVLKSERAVKISIHIVKTFIRLREYMASHKELAYQLKDLEEIVGGHSEKN